ncbi:hypothetical protein BDN72DRAFT_864172 [Pluteus cervinus]|uniref:Uncharacterized protein n=1 Tax=Pluteus cervinus TaxID=181527 RepID=A0ACD3A5T9_9AGAR|nr:hypothetical protein BDN72DRAFT_864172 [Pluteus cervinus]
MAEHGIDGGGVVVGGGIAKEFVAAHYTGAGAVRICILRDQRVIQASQAKEGEGREVVQAQGLGHRGRVRCCLVQVVPLAPALEAWTDAMERVYGELHTSFAFLRAELDDSPTEPGSHLPRAMRLVWEPTEPFFTNIHNSRTHYALYSGQFNESNSPTSDSCERAERSSITPNEDFLYAYNMASTLGIGSGSVCAGPTILRTPSGTVYVQTADDLLSRPVVTQEQGDGDTKRNSQK